MVANFRPQHLTVQWHITDSCNLRCQHCYQPGYEGKRNSLAELKEIAEQILHFHQQLAGSSPLPFLLTLTGGEPFAHPDFIKLLQFLHEHPQRPNIAILTNGMLLTETRLKLIAPIRLAFIQLSVDGDSIIHDEIRGTGNFSRVLETTKRLKAEGRRVLWSFTAHKKNIRSFATVANMARRYAVDRLWFDRLIPCRENIPDILDQAETQDFFQFAAQIKKKIERPSFVHRFLKPQSKTEISMLRALQFQHHESAPYRCQAGAGLITIMPNADVYPCRRLPVAVGNMLQMPLTEIYQNAPLFRQLREFTWPATCGKCLFKTQCRGGLRCLAWAVNHDAFTADPGCPFAARSE
ncbi:radical SAM/SPASM domain-containing protein [Citrobacter freundii]|uniref:radical SAM/SPASM domain-containing protein n=1 Tax=Citrobacter freundii TaxID=546 RepID=UPI00383B6B97